MSDDSIMKYQHRQLAEQSIANFIEYLEDEVGEPLVDEDREWLFKKGQEIFDAYYIEDRAMVRLMTPEEKQDLEAYFDLVQNSLGGMFSHIMLLEFKLYLLTKGLDI